MDRSLENLETAQSDSEASFEHLSDDGTDMQAVPEQTRSRSNSGQSGVVPACGTPTPSDCTDFTSGGSTVGPMALENMFESVRKTMEDNKEMKQKVRIKTWIVATCRSPDEN